MRLMLTGHRPDKLGGYNNSSAHKEIELKLEAILDRALVLAGKMGEELVVLTGMALGADQIWTHVALNKGVKVAAYVPFRGQESLWPQKAQVEYKNLLRKCNYITYCARPGYAAWKLQKRNRDMVNDADYCIAVWDGSRGGTANCVTYIRKEQKPLLHIHPKTFQEKWIRG